MKTFLSFLATLLFFTSVFSQTPGTVIWEFQASGEINSSPAIDDNGIIYFGSSDSSMYAVYPDGTQKWKYRTEGKIYSSPAIGNDGTIYFGSYDSCFYAINPDGTLNWKYETKGKVKSSPAISEDGTIYFGSYDSCFYAINNDGTLKWKYKTGGIIEPSPAIGNDGSIYIGSADNVFYSFSKDGIVNWTYNGSGFSSASLGFNGRIYVLCKGILFVLNKDGLMKYSCDISDTTSKFSPLVDLNESVYFKVFKYSGSAGGYEYLISFNNEGEQKWTYRGYYNLVPKFLCDTAIYLFNYSQLEKINYEGEGIWSIHNSSFYPNSYIVMNKGGLLYACLGSKLTAIKTDNDELSKSSWPSIRQNSKNTGSIENYPYALVSENHISIDSSGTILLDTSPSYDPNGEQLTYLWKIKKQPEGSSIILTDSTSPIINVEIPRTRGEYIFSVEVKNQKGKISSTIVTISNLLKWKFKTNGAISSSPAIGNDGTIYFGSDDKNLYAINPDGTKKWEFKTEGSIKSSPAIGNDGTLYFYSTAYNSDFYAVNPDGTLKWKYNTDYQINSSAAIDIDGSVYTVSRNDYYNLLSFNSDGSLKWKNNLRIDRDISPVIGSDGTIYVTGNRLLYAVNPDGTKKWEYPIEMTWASASPAIDNNGTIYIASIDYSKYPSFVSFSAINKDGTKKWEIKTKGNDCSSAVIGLDGTIYASVDTTLYAIFPDGSQKWKVHLSNYFSSTPAIGNDGNIYIGTTNGKFYAISSSGEILWKYDALQLIESSPAISNDGTIYFGSANGNLYAIFSDSKGLADSPWPKFRKNNFNTGNEYNNLTLRAKVKSNSFKMAFGIITLDGSPSLVPNGSVVSYQWDIVKKPDNAIINIKNPTSVVTEIDIPRLHASYILSLKITDTKGDSSFTYVYINNEKYWEFQIDKNYWLFSPAIGNDGTLYFVSSYDNKLYALNPDGTKKWELELKLNIDYNITKAPSIMNDNTIYLNSYKKLISVTINRTINWEYLTTNAIQNDIAIGVDGTIYFGSDDHKLYAINPDGTKKWEYIMGGKICSSPTIGSDGTIYISSEDGNFYAIKPDGTKKWSRSGGCFPSTSIGGDGTIYYGSENYLFAIKQDGTKKWAIKIGDNIYSSPAIGVDGTIYIGSDDNKFLAINPDGTKKWEFGNIGHVYHAPIIGKDGTVYIASNDSTLYAINLNGEKIWEYNSDFYFYSPPKMSDDGYIYLASPNKLTSIYTESGGVANSPWPEPSGNKFNSGMSHYIVPGFSADTLSGKFPLAVHFADTSFGNVFNRLWDFGDGQTSTEMNPVHTYAYPDSFTVTLIISNPSKTDTLTKENYIVALNATGIADNSELPKEFKLYENYPNPFNPQTNIEFDVKEKTTVKLRVYNVVGQLVTTLTDNILEAGHYKYQFSGNNLASGIYFYKIEMGKYVSIKKMMLLK